MTARDAAVWLLGRLRGERPVLVGHSLGGAVALEVALLDPQAIRGIVLVASSARLRVAPMLLEAAAAATVESPLRLDMAFGPATDSAVVEAYHARSKTTPPESSLADWQACDAFDLRARLGEVGVPVLVVFGSEDWLTPPKHQRALADALPDATLVEIEGVGHMLPWEAPERLARAVLGGWSEAIAAR